MFTQFPLLVGAIHSVLTTMACLVIWLTRSQAITFYRGWVLTVDVVVFCFGVLGACLPALVFAYFRPLSSLQFFAINIIQLGLGCCSHDLYTLGFQQFVHRRISAGYGFLILPAFFLFMTYTPIPLSYHAVVAELSQSKTLVFAFTCYIFDMLVLALRDYLIQLSIGCTTLFCFGMGFYVYRSHELAEKQRVAAANQAFNVANNGLPGFVARDTQVIHDTRIDTAFLCITVIALVGIFGCGFLKCYEPAVVPQEPIVQSAYEHLTSLFQPSAFYGWMAAKTKNLSLPFTGKTVQLQSPSPIDYSKVNMTLHANHWEEWNGIAKELLKAIEAHDYARFEDLFKKAFVSRNGDGNINTYFIGFNQYFAFVFGKASRIFGETYTVSLWTTISPSSRLVLNHPIFGQVKLLQTSIESYTNYPRTPFTTPADGYKVIRFFSYDPSVSCTDRKNLALGLITELSADEVGFLQKGYLCKGSSDVPAATGSLIQTSDGSFVLGSGIINGIPPKRFPCGSDAENYLFANVYGCLDLAPTRTSESTRAEVATLINDLGKKLENYQYLLKNPKCSCGDYVKIVEEFSKTAESFKTTFGINELTVMQSEVVSLANQFTIVLDNNADLTTSFFSYSPTSGRA